MIDLFQNVLTASFHGSIVIVAVILLRTVLKNTPKKFLCFLWLLAGLRLLMPFEIQSAFSLQPETTQLEQQIQQQWEPEITPVYNTPDQSAQQQVTVTPATQPAPVEVPQPSVEAPAPLPQMEPQPLPQEPEPFFSWEELAIGLWLSVAGCFGIYTLYCYLSLSYQVREAIKIPGGWECDRIETAFILGFIKPRIYIPMGMSKTVRRHILAHERTHLEKGDHWFKMIGFIALAVHWFNPLVWIAYVMLCKDIEMACDERVVQFMDLEERKSYSAALLSCSANRAHYAACPVAFGEVSVKDRIKSVLNYRKPSFWISLAGVVAIFFVALCLLTNPIQEPPAAEETLPVETVETEPLTEEQREEKRLSKEEELLQKVSQGVENLLTNQNATYRLAGIDEDGSVYWQCLTQKQGENIYWHLSDWRNGNNVDIYRIHLDGQTYEYRDQVFLPTQEGQPVDMETLAREWANWESMESLYSFKEVETVTSDGRTYHQIKFSGVEKGTNNRIEYTFDIGEDGSLLDMSVIGLDTSYGYLVSLSDETRAQNMQDEMSGHTVFDLAVEQIMSREEYESTKIPSNRLDYDKDFGLGSGQMRWQFFDGLWQFACGAENATATGLTMFYCESGDNHQILTADENFWLETLVDDKWQYLNPQVEGKAAAEKIQVSWNTTDRVSISWADTYGSLAPGYYRLGRFHTVTMPNGDTETQHAYVKFRIYDGNKDELLKKCRIALDNLKAGNYHLYTFDWMPDMDYDYYLRSEYWKHGWDNLQINSYPLRADMSTLTSVNSSLWRDGMSYGITWEGEPMASKIKEWTLNRPGYMDGGNVETWLFGLEWYDAQVMEVYQDGNNIHILEIYDFDDRYENKELVITLDNGGNLKGIKKSYLPKRSCAEHEKVAGQELVVFDTTPAEIAGIIDSVDLTQPMAFSYAEDEAANPEAQRIAFKNTTPKTVNTAADALALAHEECTLPKLMEFDKGYCQSQTYYDESTGMWKVRLFWWQHDSEQTIYMDSQGITRMMVTVG